MKHTFTTQIYFILALLLIGAKGALASDVCFTCHEKDQFKDTFIHKPVMESQCSSCHNPHVARYKGLLREREDVLCYSCHTEKKKAFSEGNVHSPITQGQCNVCHTPHASSVKGLVSANLAADCFACHTKLEQEYKQPHKPYADGNCTACHQPHQSENRQLLTGAADTLCFSCHSSDTLQASHKDYPRTLGNCLSCHNPHGSDRKGLIRNFLHKPYEEGCTACHQGSATVSMATCLQCHETTGQQLLAQHSHITLNEGNSCLNCHSPHAGDDKSLLKDREEQVCRSCHSETLARYRKTASQHPPAKSCSTCHEPHGSKKLAMLKGDGNAICVNCHKTQGKFTHPVGPDILNSHTGQMVTCVSCHNPMGTEHNFHLLQEGKKALCVICHRTY